MLNDKIIFYAQQLVNVLHAKGLKITTAESCTGGLIAASITAIAGASDVFDCAFVTYSNQIKHEVIAVDKEVLEKHGAVSEQVALEMAVGVLNKANADISVSVTGIAGPSGGSVEKPVGLVYIAIAHKLKGDDITIQSTVIKNNFLGNRNDIRMQTTQKALEEATKVLL